MHFWKNLMTMMRQRLLNWSLYSHDCVLTNQKKQATPNTHARFHLLGFIIIQPYYYYSFRRCTFTTHSQYRFKWMVITAAHDWQLVSAVCLTLSDPITSPIYLYTDEYSVSTRYEVAGSLIGRTRRGSISRERDWFRLKTITFTVFIRVSVTVCRSHRKGKAILLMNFNSYVTIISLLNHRGH